MQQLDYKKKKIPAARRVSLTDPALFIRSSNKQWIFTRNVDKASRNAWKATGKLPIGNAQPVGGRKKKKKERRRERKNGAQKIYSARIRAADTGHRFSGRVPIARWFRPPQERVAFVQNEPISLFLSLSLSRLYCIAFYLRRATDTIADRRGLPLPTLNLALLVKTTSSKPNVQFYCERHAGNLEICSAS